MTITKKKFTITKQYKTGGDYVNEYGESKFFRGKGLKKDRNIDTWEDKRQDQYLKWLEEQRAKESKK